MPWMMTRRRFVRLAIGHAVRTYAPALEEGAGQFGRGRCLTSCVWVSTPGAVRVLGCKRYHGSVWEWFLVTREAVVARLDRET